MKPYKNVITLVFLLSTMALSAQTADTIVQKVTTPTLFEQLYNDSISVLKIELETDLRNLVRNKNDETYQPAIIRYRNAQDSLISWEIDVRTRGNARKQICTYPPLRLKFSKDSLRTWDIDSDNKIKLVNQCTKGNVPADYIYKEFLAYKLYNTITPFSFRVQLVEITYIDTGKKNKRATRPGFLIEPIEDLAKRLNGVEIEREKISVHQLEKYFAKQMSIFQYMIGNTDWNVGNLHNLKLIKVEQFPRVIPIPYDFDYAGLVNAHYATPRERLPIKSVKERWYLGGACSDAELQKYIKTFQEKKHQVHTTMEQTSSYFSKPNTSLKKYIEDFYEMLEDQKRCKRVFG